MAQSRLPIAAAGALALCVACVQAAPRESASEAQVASSTVASTVEPVLPTAIPAPDFAPVEEPMGAGPLGALGQMVTTQALLVSLFLAPVSKDGSQVLARADASAQDGGTRQR